MLIALLAYASSETRTSRAANKRLNMAKEAMFKDSQKLYVLRQEEANLIAEICGAQAR